MERANIFSKLTFVVGFLAMVGCGEKDPGFSLLPDGDVFQQSPSSVRSAIDVLWVIDNSGSMESSQQNVVNNLSSFMQSFQSKNLDFKMAITTTDAYRTMYNSNQNCSQFRNGILNSSCNVVSGATYSPYRILDNLTPDLLNNFMINAIQTDTARSIYGSGDERAFQSLKTALDSSLNTGFIRGGSFFSVIIVSDEDDFSYDGSQAIENMGAPTYPYRSNPWSYPNLHTVQSYVDYLDAKTASSGTNRRYNVNSMAILDSTCQTQLNTSFTGRKIGQRYIQLSDLTDGVKSSLCGNFATELELIADRIITLATQFYLNRIPKVETIVVKSDSTVVPERSANPLGNGGWEYDPATNSIKFYGSFIPSAGAKIYVTYDPVAYGQ
jgi:hypothetical protein